MARCECGSLYVPTGENVKITFKQGGLSTHMYLEHDRDMLVFDEETVVSYGQVPASPSVTPSLVSISFDNAENLKTVGMMKLTVRKGNVKIIEKYFGTKDREWTLPLVDDLPTVTASCSDIINNVDVSNSRIYVEITSVCDSSPGDCCGNTVDISFRNVVHTICIEDVATTIPPDHVSWRYTVDGDNCRQDVNGEFFSYPECYASINQSELVTTSTTCDPSDPDCTTEEPTTTEDPAVSNFYNWTLQHEFYPSGDSDFVNALDMSDDGSVLSLCESYTGASNPMIRVMKIDPSCDWYQLGDNINGLWKNVGITANGSGVVSGNRTDYKVYAHEWNGTSWVPSGTPFYVGDSGRIEMTQITPDGKYIVAANPSHDSSKGTVEVHEWNGSDWAIKGTVGEMLGYAGNLIGNIDLCISDDGNTVLAAPATAVGSPRVKAWEWDGLNWTQKGQSILPTVSLGEEAQTDITMSSDGNRITVGCAETNAIGNNSGMIRTWGYNQGLDSWEILDTIYGTGANQQIGNDNSSTMSRDGSLLLYSKYNSGKLVLLGWNGGDYIAAKTDNEVDMFNWTDTSFGYNTTMSQNGKVIVGISTSTSASGVCQVIQSNNYLCDSVTTAAPTTTPAPTTTLAPTTTTTTTTTTTLAP